VSLVGSTGSIGTQAIEVVEAEPDRFRIVALAAHRSVDLLVDQARRLRPDLVAIGDPGAFGEVAGALPGIQVVAGEDGLREAAARGDVVVNGVVGFAGLTVTLAALNAGRRLALANKESIIAGGPLVARARLTAGAEVLPVDSEHCALHQCLRAGDAPEVATLLLTASGGPFRGRSREQLAAVDVSEALQHPTWSMGPKITVDSSTLMNKGLEVIEAHELFGIPYEAIDVVVHPQSIVHSMVAFRDGAVMASFDLVVEIEEAPAEALGKQTAGGGLAGAHEAGENDAIDARRDGSGGDGLLWDAARGGALGQGVIRAGFFAGVGFCGHGLGLGMGGLGEGCCTHCRLRSCLRGNRSSVWRKRKTADPVGCGLVTGGDLWVNQKRARRRRAAGRYQK